MGYLSKGTRKILNFDKGSIIIYALFYIPTKLAVALLWYYEIIMYS